MRGNVAQRPFLRRRLPISEINMTPLIDLVFLLLITFVITFPLVQHGIPLKLPKGKASELPAENKRTISLDLQGGIYLEDHLCTLEKLTDEMMTLGQSRPDTVILVRADEGIPYGQVVRILKILHDARLSRMALVTQIDRKGKS